MYHLIFIFYYFYCMCYNNYYYYYYSGCIRICSFYFRHRVLSPVLRCQQLAADRRTRFSSCAQCTHVSLVFFQAFAWFSDLLVEHADIFWSLFSVDMMSVLEQQPEDQWDSFPLFQLLNDYLREDGE
jgi:hypothetical protein